MPYSILDPRFLFCDLILKSPPTMIVCLQRSRARIRVHCPEGVLILGIAMAMTSAQAVSISTNFNQLSANNDANNGIGSSYLSGDFQFSSSGLFYRGQRSIYYPGSGALYTSGSSVMMITRAGGQTFNFYAADVAERENAPETAGFRGTRADGSTVTSSTRLDGIFPSSQNLGFAGFTNLVSLQFSGGDQLDRIVFSDLVPPPVSDATVTFDSAALGPVSGVYGEAGYLLTSSPAAGLAVQSTMNDSHALGVTGVGTIDLTSVGGLYALRGFDIHSNLGEKGSFRLTVTDSNGIDHVSSTFALGSYNEAALLQMFGGQAFTNQITRARFENLTGQGVVLDNIYAIPEPSTLLLAALGVLLIGARTSFRAT